MKLRSMYALSFAAIVAMGAANAALAAEAFRTAKPGEWRYYAGTLGGQKYSALDQINAGNVGKLKMAWHRPSAPPEVRSPGGKPLVGVNHEHTPLMVDGRLYLRSEAGPVMALNPGTGDILWTDKKASTGGGRSKGVSYWTDGKDSRIFAMDGENLVALNAKTGERYADFGAGGSVDLKVYADPRPNSPVGAFRWGGFPVVVGDIVVIAGAPSLDKKKVPEGMKPALDAPGDIRGYNARTGKLEWTFHVIPRKGEYGYETWANGSSDMNGLGGTWSWLTADEDLGYVYIATEAPSNDFYGANRPGNNLFGNSVLTLDAKTGKRVWHYQIVHHDIWDFDLPTPPVLMDITVDGKPIKALAQLSKMGLTFVLDRTNGQPVWPIEEKAVGQAATPGEFYSKTQPFPTKPAPLDLIQLTEDDLIDFTPELRAAAKEVIKNLALTPLYTPATTDREIVMMPGTTGAANWPGGAFDPDTQMFYVPVVRNPVRTMLMENKDKTEYAYDRKPESGSLTSLEIPYQNVSPTKPLADGDVSRLPLTKPPYGSVVALDMKTGEQKWRVANGDGLADHPALKGLNLPMLGTHNRGAPLLTKSLLFLGEGQDGPTGPSRVPTWGGGKKFRALDKATGKILWETQMAGGTAGAPMTYMYNGKQYVAVVVGWHDMSTEVVAFALE